MERLPPPPVINCARVLAYAYVDDIVYRPWGALLVGGIPVEHVPQLAICANLDEDNGPLIFHCDRDWNVLGTAGGATVVEVKDRAEKNYPGVGSRWVDTGVTVEQALTYYDEQTGGKKCSFCGRRAFEVEGWIEAPDAIVCTGCVQKHRGDLHSAPGK